MMKNAEIIIFMPEILFQFQFLLWKDQIILFLRTHLKFAYHFIIFWATVIIQKKKIIECLWNKKEKRKCLIQVIYFETIFFFIMKNEIIPNSTARLAWPHFWLKCLHCQPNVDFCPKIEPAKSYCDLTCVHLITKSLFSMSKSVSSVSSFWFFSYLLDY